MDRRRFERLERARPDGAEVPASGAAERVAGVESAPAGLPSASGLSRGRFEDGVPLAAAAEGPLFHRCRLCGADSQRGALRCQHCEADLQTPEQAAFDRRLFERQAEDLRREEAERAAAAAQPAVPGSEQRALGEAVAAAVAEEEEAALAPGRRWLRHLPWPARLGVAAAFVTLLGLSAHWSRTSPRWSLAFIIECLLLLLFVPADWWGRLGRPGGRW